MQPVTRRKVAERPGMPVESAGAMDARMTSDRMLVSPVFRLKIPTTRKMLIIWVGCVPLAKELSSSNKCSAPEPLGATVPTNVRTKADQVANHGTKGSSCDDRCTDVAAATVSGNQFSKCGVGCVFQVFFFLSSYVKWRPRMV